MRILGICGNHNRHFYYMNNVHKELGLAGIIIQDRESFTPDPPGEILVNDRENYIHHFNYREQAESKYFGIQTQPDCPFIKVNNDSLNSQESVGFLKEINPELVLIFGSGLIKEPLFSALPAQSINLHLGLSPRYRGAATLFWPFYFLEPNHAGATLHYIVSEPDAGGVIHQVTPKLELSDGIHDVSCKTLCAATSSVIQLSLMIRENHAIKVQNQKGTGKNFLYSDFKPEHLRVIYDLYDDAIVREFLEGRLQVKDPVLFRQF